MGIGKRILFMTMGKKKKGKELKTKEKEKEVVELRKRGYQQRITFLWKQEKGGK